jgi:hypothetical protein
MPVPGRCLGFVLDDAIDLLRWDTEPHKRIRGRFLRLHRHSERLSVPPVGRSDRAGLG